MIGRVLRASDPNGRLEDAGGAKESTKSIVGLKGHLTTPNMVNLRRSYESKQMGFRYTSSNQLEAATDI
jgi:hypothetical protein